MAVSPPIHQHNVTAVNHTYIIRQGCVAAVMLRAMRALVPGGGGVCTVSPCRDSIVSSKSVTALLGKEAVHASDEDTVLDTVLRCVGHDK